MKVRHKTFPEGGRWETTDPRSLPRHGNDPYCLVTFHDETGYEIGYVTLCKTRWGFWETHSELMDDYHNKGYGIRMYNAAIRYALKRGWKVSSSLSYSGMAERLWRSRRLRTKHKIRKRGDRFYVG